mmetsp:Transcript_26723/g.61543  ORF Transcript_26723/g.61543 Transcript_26723/m.61543 type:complete len:178 (-) Transcript_26723:115-648(-)
MGNSARCCCQDQKEDSALATVDSQPMADARKDVLIDAPLAEIQEASFILAPPDSSDTAKDNTARLDATKYDTTKVDTAKADTTKVDTTSGDSYLVTITRGGQRLGMMIYNEVGEENIYVRNVKEGMLVDQWNLKNPDKPLKKGAAICAVNGKRRPDEMRDELTTGKSDTLEILVKCK